MNLIAAVDRNWAIGRNGKLLVSIPQDMAYFRQMTTGKVVIMGRKTLESFPKKKPLRNRAENIVITRQMDYQAEGATVVHSVEEALNAAARYDTRDVFVIGGGEVYRSLLPYCDTAYITKIDFAYDADTRLPDLDHDPEWEKVRATDELTYFDLVYEFDTYRRK
ncbi:dihydrofolate reductase [Chordicoccus furentiruminis]|uniref:dihydrofolate reductase n=1 Tax=Chordicoccus furentiruminis TaxID=2709410 RepID=UPI0023A7A789|nr:dihydrofolate reductase [Chordicoccus furentiruminis]